MFYKDFDSTFVPFKFSPEQRVSLISCFGGNRGFKTEKSTRAPEFINELELKLEFWQTMQSYPVMTNSSRDVRLSKIVSQCERLIESVHEVDFKTCGGFRDELDGYFIDNKIDLFASDCDKAVKGLMATAQLLAKRLEGSRSQSKAREKHLVALTLDCYRQIFGSSPGIGVESNFSKVMIEVGLMFNVTIGQPIIESVVSDTKESIDYFLFY